MSANATIDRVLRAVQDRQPAVRSAVLRRWNQPNSFDTQDLQNSSIQQGPSQPASSPYIPPKAATKANGENWIGTMFNADNVPANQDLLTSSSALTDSGFASQSRYPGSEGTLSVSLSSCAADSAACHGATDWQPADFSSPGQTDSQEDTNTADSLTLPFSNEPYHY